MLTRLGRSRWLAAALLALVVPTSVGAQEPVITLREAISRTLQSNPDLAAYAYTLKAQDGRITQSGLRPNPTLSGTVENVLGTGQASGGKYAEVTLMLSQVIELGGLRDRRIDVARRERDGLQAEGEIQRLDTVAETARRFVSLASQQEQHQLTHLAVELAEKTAAAVEKRVAAAKSPLAERDRAAVALQRAQNDDAHAEHELQTARYALAASWGATKPDFVSASADLYELPMTRSYDELLVALETTPDLTRYLSETRLRDAEIALAIAGRRQGFQLGAGVRRLEQSNDTGLVFSFQMPLPVRDRNQGLIAEAEARREGAAAEREATLIKARTQLLGYYRELLDRQRQVGLIREQALPRMESALANTDYAYERGRYSYLELVDAQREMLELKREAIEAAAQYHFNLIEIERLTGNGLSR